MNHSIRFLPGNVSIDVEAGGRSWRWPPLQGYISMPSAAARGSAANAGSIWSRGTSRTHIDIGTSGEIVVGNREWLICAALNRT
jgi:uncharacterized 2Fe-2S/4Fe-4S cluster protein (DUF4445 family)